MTREEKTSPLLSSLLSSLLSPFISCRLSSPLPSDLPSPLSSPARQFCRKSQRRSVTSATGSQRHSATSRVQRDTSVANPNGAAPLGVSSETRAWPIPMAERPTHAYATLLFAASHCIPRYTPPCTAPAASACHCALRNVRSKLTSTNQRIPCACHDFVAPHTSTRTRAAISHRATKSNGFSSRTRHARRDTFCRQSQGRSASGTLAGTCGRSRSLGRTPREHGPPPRPPLKSKSPSLRIRGNI